MTYRETINHLLYASYRHNRLVVGMSTEDLAKLFGQKVVEKMEAKLQEGITK